MAARKTAARPPTSTAPRRRPPTSTRPPRPAKTPASPEPSPVSPAPVTGEQDEQQQEPRGSATNRAAVEGAGAFLALFAIPLIVNLIEGGPAQMWGWVKAKWLNEPYALGPAPSKGGKQVYPTPTGQAPPPTTFQQITQVSR